MIRKAWLPVPNSGRPDQGLCLILQWMEMSCNSTHNLWTGVALFFKESSHVFQILSNLFNTYGNYISSFFFCKTFALVKVKDFSKTGVGKAFFYIEGNIFLSTPPSPCLLYRDQIFTSGSPLGPKFCTNLILFLIDLYSFQSSVFLIQCSKSSAHT